MGSDYQSIEKPTDNMELSQQQQQQAAAPGAATNATTHPATTTIDIDDAMDALEFGIFQWQILLAAGLCFAADAMEVLLLSFLSTILQVEWQLEGHQMDTIIAVVFAGAMTGTLVLSPLGDKFGRKPMFSITAAIITIFGLLTALCTSYVPLLLTRFMVGFGVGGLVIPFDVLSEFVPTSNRGSSLLYIEFFWTGGTLLVPVFAWMTLGSNGEDDGSDGSWRLFVVLCAIPCLISTALGMLLVPESPRWLLTQGRHDEALAIMQQAAHRNGKPELFSEPGLRITTHESHHEEAGFKELISPQWRNTTLKLWGVWFGMAFLYYGVIIAVGIIFSEYSDQDENNGAGYDFDYSAIFISASSEVFGLLLVLYTIDRHGRILTQTTAYVTGGITCLLLGLAAGADAPRSWLIALSFVARMAMMAASCTTWVSTSEILSTEIRATGHGVANAMARLGGFFCPYIISEHTPIHRVGGFMFAVSVVTASFAWYLPETTGQSLGEGVERKDRKKQLQAQQEGTTPVAATGYQIM